MLFCANVKRETAKLTTGHHLKLQDTRTSSKVLDTILFEVENTKCLPSSLPLKHNYGQQQKFITEDYIFNSTWYMEDFPQHFRKYYSKDSTIIKSMAS